MEIGHGDCGRTKLSCLDKLPTPHVSRSPDHEEPDTCDDHTDRQHLHEPGSAPARQELPEDQSPELAGGAKQAGIRQELGDRLDSK